MAEYEIQVVPIDPYSYEGEGCVCVVVEHNTGKPVPCPNLNDVAEEGWMALRGPGGKLLGVICPKHVPVFRVQIEEEGGKLPIRLEGTRTRTLFYRAMRADERERISIQ